MLGIDDDDDDAVFLFFGSVAVVVVLVLVLLLLLCNHPVWTFVGVVVVDDDDDAVFLLIPSLLLLLLLLLLLSPISFSISLSFDAADADADNTDDVNDWWYNNEEDERDCNFNSDDVDATIVNALVLQWLVVPAVVEEEEEEAEVTNNNQNDTNILLLLLVFFFGTTKNIVIFETKQFGLWYDNDGFVRRFFCRNNFSLTLCANDFIGLFKIARNNPWTRKIKLRARSCFFKSPFLDSDRNYFININLNKHNSSKQGY